MKDIGNSGQKVDFLKIGRERNGAGGKWKRKLH